MSGHDEDRADGSSAYGTPVLDFVLTVSSPPDKEGKSSFDLTWTDRYGRHRGQCFRANVTEHANRILSNGHRLFIVPYANAK